jgi:hypothetical protein
LQRKFTIMGPNLFCCPLVERKLLALFGRIGMRRPRQGGQCVCANERIPRSLARFPKMSWRSQVPELVFRVAKHKQHRRTIARVGWFRECPAQLLRRGVRRTARQRRPRGLPQHGDDVAVAARRRRDQVDRDRTRVGTLVRQQLGRTRVQIGPFESGQIVVDRGSDNRMDKAQRLSADEDSEVDETGG